MSSLSREGKPKAIPGRKSGHHMQNGLDFACARRACAVATWPHEEDMDRSRAFGGNKLRRRRTDVRMIAPRRKGLDSRDEPRARHWGCCPAPPDAPPSCRTWPRRSHAQSSPHPYPRASERSKREAPSAARMNRAKTTRITAFNQTPPIEAHRRPNNRPTQGVVRRLLFVHEFRRWRSESPVVQTPCPRTSLPVAYTLVSLYWFRTLERSRRPDATQICHGASPRP